MILIKKASIFASSTPMKIQDILVEGNMIQQIDDHISLHDLPPDASVEVIEANERLVLPGMVNTHTHASMSLFQGFAEALPFQQWHQNVFPYELQLQSQHTYWGAMLSMIDMIRSGTTMFNDMYIHMDGVAEAVKDIGMRASLARGMIFADDQVDQRIQDGVQFAQRWNGAADGRITTMLAPHSLYLCSMDHLSRIGAIAYQESLPVHTHFLEHASERPTINEQTGRRPAEVLLDAGLIHAHVPLLLAHGIHVDDHDLAILSQGNVSVSHCPGSNWKLGCGFFPLSAYEAYDIPVHLGTDGLSTSLSLDMYEQLHLCLLGQRQYTGDMNYPSLEQLSHMVTDQGMRSLGHPLSGRLRPGYCADLQLLDIRPRDRYPDVDEAYLVTHVLHQGLVNTTVIDGTIVMQDREIQTIDEEEVLYHVQQYKHQLR